MRRVWSGVTATGARKKPVRAPAEGGHSCELTRDTRTTCLCGHADPPGRSDNAVIAAPRDRGPGHPSLRPGQKCIIQQSRLAAPEACPELSTLFRTTEPGHHRGWGRGAFWREAAAPQGPAWWRGRHGETAGRGPRARQWLRVLGGGGGASAFAPSASVVVTIVSPNADHGPVPAWRPTRTPRFSWCSPGRPVWPLPRTERALWPPAAQRGGAAETGLGEPPRGASGA